MAACHVCASTSFEPAIPDEGGALKLNRCSTCEFVYLEEWEESLRRQSELYDYYSRIDESALPARHSPENRARQAELLDTLSRLVGSRRLLDVGCGDGQFLQTATEEGWDAVGIDLSEPAVELCRSRGLNASCADFFDGVLEEGSFDAVIMSELIEHVPAPQSFLTRAEELLAPGGILYLTTPNFGSLSRRMLGYGWSVVCREHIGYFDKKTLHALAKRHTNLQTLRIETNNLSPSAFLTWIRRRNESTAEDAANLHRVSRTGADQRLRRVIHGSRALRAAKSIVNRGISRAAIGDTLVAWLQKPTP